MKRYHFSRLPVVSQIPRVDNPPWEVFERYFVAQAAPVVITGSPLFAGQPLTLEDMARPDVAGHIQVNVRSGNYMNVSTRRNERMALADYVESIIRPLEQEGGGAEGRGLDGAESLPRYAGNTPLTYEQFEALGFRAPRFFEGKACAAPRLWFGPKGSATPLHYDSRDNLICQYIGRKHLTLFPPSQIPLLYTSGYAPSWSGVADPRFPDMEKYPRFAAARPVEVTLEAGEILYLPARWAHFVQNLDTSVMVNFWPEHTSAQKARMTLEARARQWKWRLAGLPQKLRIRSAAVLQKPADNG